MQFLLTNDDGFDAPGLAALRRAVEQLGEVVVVAPRSHQSGVSHRATTDSAVAVEQRGSGEFAVDGTPVDCVRLGLLELAPGTDWVLSGVNEGGNLGVDAHMSGTVAAAREAALLGRPAAAWSQYVRRPGPVDWQAAADMVLLVWSHLQEGQPLGERAFWNVNLPHGPDRRSLPEPTRCHADPHPLSVSYELSDGMYYYRGRYEERPRMPGRDVDVCFSGGIAVSRLTADVPSS